MAAAGDVLHLGTLPRQLHRGHAVYVTTPLAALAGAAREAGAEPHGPVAQGLWLGRLGIAARAARLKQGATAAQARNIDAALVRLTDPAAMGRLFKALALVPPGFGPPAGFA